MAVTCAVTGVSVRVERPSGITRALDCGLVLLAHLAALEVAAAVVHHFTGLVSGVQMKPRGAGAHHTFPRCNCALVTTAASRYETQI